MITKLLNSNILNNNRGSIHTRRFRHIPLSIFRYRLLKNSINGSQVETLFVLIVLHSFPRQFTLTMFLYTQQNKTVQELYCWKLTQWWTRNGIEIPLLVKETEISSNADRSLHQMKLKMPLKYNFPYPYLHGHHKLQTVWTYCQNPTSMYVHPVKMKQRIISTSTTEVI